MKPGNAHASSYQTPHSRWFDAELRDRDELRKTYLAFEQEFGLDAAVSKAVVALARAARKAQLKGDAAAARCHLQGAAATLMASPSIHRARGGALASMLATQAAGQHRSQKFRVAYG